MDELRNFATSTVATAPSPADEGTSLTVASGTGSRFPTAPFNVEVVPADARPTPANSEVVRVTAKSTDTFTITRGYESSTARSIVVGDKVHAGVTAGTFAGLSKAGIENGQPGLIAPTSRDYIKIGSSNAAQRCTLARFVPSRDLAVTKMAYLISTAGGAGDNIDIGIYNSGLTTLLGSSGLVAPGHSTLGLKLVSLTATVNLTAGTVYYAAFNPNVTAGAVHAAWYDPADRNFWFGTAIGTFETGFKDVGQNTLPASIATPTVSGAIAAIIAIREV